MSDRLYRAFISLKDRANTICIEIDGINNLMRAAQSTAIAKRDLAMPLLRICQEWLLDGSLVESVFGLKNAVLYRAPLGHRDHKSKVKS